MKTLAEWILGCGISQTEIGRRLGHANAGMVTNVVKGLRAIPRSKIDDWASAMELPAEAIPAFRADALRVKRYRKTDTREANAELDARVRRLEALVPVLRDLVAGAARGEVKLPEQLRERIRTALESVDPSG